MTQTAQRAPGVLVIRLPLCPDAEVSPNWRGHWRRKATAVRVLREIAYLSATQAMWTQDWGTAVGPVTVRTTIAWGKGRRIMDGDNALAACKAAFDGLTDAAVWTDDKQCTFLPVYQERDATGVGYMIVAVEA